MSNSQNSRGAPRAQPTRKAQGKKKKKKIKRVNGNVQTPPPRRRRRRRGRFLLYYILMGLFAVAMGIILSLTVFFKIENIRVVGNTIYQEAAIVDTAGILPGENLFRIKGDVAKERILKTYPYIENVRLQRKLPVTLVLNVEEATPMGSFVQDDGSYVLVSEKGRVLQIGTGDPPPDELQVFGVQIQGYNPCDQLPDELSEPMTMFRYLKQAVEETHFTDITSVDLSDKYNICVYYQDRLRIELGSEGDLADKLSFVEYAIANDIDPGFEGLVDVTIPKQVRIRKMEIHEKGYHPDLPDQETETPEPDPSAQEDQGEQPQTSSAPVSDGGTEVGEP